MEPVLISHSRPNNLESAHHKGTCSLPSCYAVGLQHRARTSENAPSSPLGPELTYCSFQIRPVTLSFSSFRSPPEKNRAMFLWMISPS